MTEADLDLLLTRGARRLRLQAALRLGLVALALALLCAAALIFWARSTASSNAVAAGLFLPPLITLLACVAAFFRFRPENRQVALRLDRAAATDEHLVTWYELRQAPASSTASTLHLQFKAAQRDATLARGAALNAGALLPLRLPEWSRALWLAGLLLCCALLMPEARSLSANAPVMQNDNPLRFSIAQGGGGGDSGEPSADAGADYVDPLSKTDMWELQFKVSDPNLNAEEKEQLYNRVMGKVGDIPINALSPELREMLQALQSGMREKKPDAKSGAGESGSAQTTSDDADAEKPSSTGTTTGVASIPAEMEKALTTVREHFADVEEDLRRYYSNSHNKGELEK
jgi:hypothetical protein